jgi:hypothetical protein
MIGLNAGHAPAEPLRPRILTWLRTASFFAAFALASLLVWKVGASIAQASRLPRPNMTLDLFSRLAEWRSAIVLDKSARRVGMIGDSMVFTEGPGTSMPDWVRTELEQHESNGAHAAVHVLSFPAWSTIGQYCMAGELASAKPSLLVLELNLRLLGPAPLGAFAYTELSGFIDDSRIPEAAFLPLSQAGITLSTLLFDRALVKTGRGLSWNELLVRQATLFNTRAPLEAWLDEKMHRTAYEERRVEWGIALSGRFLVSRGSGARDSVPHARAALGDVLDGIGTGHPRLVVLAAMLSTFHRRKVPVLVWVSPINVEHLRSLGFSLEGVDRSLRTIQDIVEGSGATLLDLHALLPDTAFSDSGDHYTFEGHASGRERVGREIGAAIAWAMERHAVQ